jgi:hypothetical protein
MSIVEPPTDKRDVPVNVRITGDCCHVTHNAFGNLCDKTTLPNRRFLAGSSRRQRAETINNCGQSATEEYFRAVGDLTEAECHAGNMSHCQTPQVLRQATYERRMNDRLHHDVILELDIQREAWAVSIPGKQVNGYIQFLAMYPFTVTFYCEAQIKCYIDYCTADASSTVNFDATGSIIKDIRNQKRPFYYCLLMADGGLPTLDFITTCHKSYHIKSQLDAFNATVRSLNNGKQVNPQYVVTDFSVAVMDACLRSFNGSDGQLFPICNTATEFCLAKQTNVE